LLGLGLSLFRLRRWPYALLLAWFPVMLVGGVFSLTFEAPQSLRTIDEVTVVAVFAGVALGALWQAVDAIVPPFRALRTVATTLVRRFRPARAWVVPSISLGGVAATAVIAGFAV